MIDETDDQTTCYDPKLEAAAAAMNDPTEDKVETLRNDARKTLEFLRESHSDALAQSDLIAVQVKVLEKNIKATAKMLGVPSGLRKPRTRKPQPPP